MRFLAFIYLISVALPGLADEPELPELSFEQRKAINELKARGGTIVGYLRKDRAISLTLPENFADADLDSIQPILEWPLERLYVHQTKLSEAALRELLLRQKKLQGFIGVGKNLTDTALQGLKKAPVLYQLELIETAVTAELFNGQGFAALHSLHITNHAWPAKSYAMLGDVNIHYLRLMRQTLKEEDLAEVAKLKKVKRLSLIDCPIQPSGWEALAEATQLDELSLQGTGIKA